jgi:hypothetical protein
MISGSRKTPSRLRSPTSADPLSLDTVGTAVPAVSCFRAAEGQYDSTLVQPRSRPPRADADVHEIDPGEGVHLAQVKPARLVTRTVELIGQFPRRDGRLIHDPDRVQRPRVLPLARGTRDHNGVSGEQPSQGGRESGFFADLADSGIRWAVSIFRPRASGSEVWHRPRRSHRMRRRGCPCHECMSSKISTRDLECCGA